MMNKLSKVMMVVLIGAMLLAANVGLVAAAGGPPTDRGMGRGAYGTGTGLVASGELTDAQVDALTALWMDEYNALRTYEAIIADFGDVLPFTSVASAEATHIQSLERAFTRYGIEVPAAPGAVDVNFATLQDACAAAAQAETDNAGLYTELESTFTQSDLLRVFNQLSSASLNSHLPAFESCTDGDYVPSVDGAMSQYGWSSDAGVRGNGARGTGQNNGTRDMLRTPTEDCPVDGTMPRFGR